MIVEEIIKNGATLIDVRDEMELLLDGSIASAHHIPLSEISMKEEEIKALPKPVVVFCKSGGRAGKAVDYLTSVGIEDVHNGGGYTFVASVLNE